MYASPRRSPASLVLGGTPSLGAPSPTARPEPSLSRGYRSASSPVSLCPTTLRTSPYPSGTIPPRSIPPRSSTIVTSTGRPPPATTIPRRGNPYVPSSPSVGRALGLPSSGTTGSPYGPLASPYRARCSVAMTRSSYAVSAPTTRAVAYLLPSPSSSCGVGSLA